MAVGICEYAGYVPRYRIKRDEYINALGMFSARDVQEKAIPGYDEDTITMAVKATGDALKRVNINPDKISALFFASTTPPYEEKGSSSTVSAALNLSSDVRVSDFGFSTKAGGDALLACIEYISSGQGGHGIVVASDNPKAHVGDSIEHGLGAGAAAFIIGSENVAVRFEDYYASNEETLGERYRKTGHSYIEDISIAAYTQSVFQRLTRESLLGLIKKLKITQEEIAYLILHQSDIRQATRLAIACGFKESQLTPGIVASFIGDAGVSTTLLGFVSVLNRAKAGDRVLVNFYGSGSGCITLSFMVEEDLASMKKTLLLDDYLKDKEYVDYLTYLKLRKII